LPSTGSSARSSTKNLAQMPSELEIVAAQLVLARLHEVFNQHFFRRFGAVVLEG